MNYQLSKLIFLVLKFYLITITVAIHVDLTTSEKYCQAPVPTCQARVQLTALHISLDTTPSCMQHIIYNFSHSSLLWLCYLNCRVNPPIMKTLLIWSKWNLTHQVSNYFLCDKSCLQIKCGGKLSPRSPSSPLCWLSPPWRAAPSTGPSMTGTPWRGTTPSRSLTASSTTSGTPSTVSPPSGRSMSRYVRMFVRMSDGRWCWNVTVFRLTSRATELFTRPTLLLTSTRMEEQFLWMNLVVIFVVLFKPTECHWRSNLVLCEHKNVPYCRERKVKFSVMALHGVRGKLIGVIGDEDTCVGFLLGGIGELNKNRQPNFLVVDKNTPLQDIEDTVKSFMKRSDISIILINQNIAEMVGPYDSEQRRKKWHYYSYTRFATSLMHTPPQSLRYWRFLARTVLMTPTRTLFSGTSLLYLPLSSRSHLNTSFFRRAKGLFSADDLK